MSKYIVMIEPFEDDGSDFVRDGCGSMWTALTPLKLFNTKEEAQVEADRWNTGEVVEFDYKSPLFNKKGLLRDEE